MSPPMDAAAASNVDRGLSFECINTISSELIPRDCFDMRGLDDFPPSFLFEGVELVKIDYP